MSGPRIALYWCACCCSPSIPLRPREASRCSTTARSWALFLPLPTEDYSSRMFRHLEWLLKELSLDLSRFDAFAVASGPGSFTGLRVGLAAVKGWAEVYSHPILSVNVLEAIAAQSRSSTTLLAPVFDARRVGSLFRVLPAAVCQVWNLSGPGSRRRRAGIVSRRVFEEA